MGDRQTALDFIKQAEIAANDKTQASYLAHAYSLFSSACMADPTYADGFYRAGNNNSDLEHNEAAIACWQRALQCEAVPIDQAKMHVNLGWRYHTLGRTDEAMQATQKALEFDPDLAFAWLNMSLIYQTQGKATASVGMARKAFELAPEDLHCEIALAFALLFDGQYAEGFKHFEKRFAWRLHNFLHFPYPRWEGQEGKTIYLCSDQGLGDTLSFARFVEAASKKCKYIHACVHSELMRLFQHSFLHLPNVNLIPMPAPFPQADYWTTFVSLPSALGLTDAEIREQPHIDSKGVPGNSSINWKVPDRKLHIGIAWAGSKLNDIDKYRNIPVEQFFELYRVPGVQLYSLQVGERSHEMIDKGGAALVRDLSPYIRDVTDTLAILKHLDLVITCETALGHICALAGKEAWIPYSYLGRDYRIGTTGDKLLWTPKHTIFRQDKSAAWRPVFERIIKALRERVDGRT